MICTALRAQEKRAAANANERNCRQKKRRDAAWESTGLVSRTVFKTAEAAAMRLVGSIPTLSRHSVFEAHSIVRAIGRLCAHHVLGRVATRPALRALAKSHRAAHDKKA